MRLQLLTEPDEFLIDKSADKYILIDRSVKRICNHKLLKNKCTTIKISPKPECYIKTLDYIYELVDKVIDTYAEVLNNQLSLTLSNMQWGLILRQLLVGLLCDFYDCYNRIHFIKEQVYIVADGKSDKTIYLNGDELGKLEVYSTKFRTTIYKKIFEYLNLPIVTKEYSLNEKLQKKWMAEKDICLGRIERVRKEPIRVWKKIQRMLNIDNSGSKSNIKMIQYDGEVLVVHSRMPDEMEAAIEDKAKKKIKFIKGTDIQNQMHDLIENILPDIEGRKKCFNQMSGKGFESILDKILVDFIPVSYIEAVPILYEKAKEITKSWNYRKIYHSAYTPELVMMCFAIMKEKGIPIYDIQHSVAYGNNFFLGFSEYKTWDYFLTWGWKPTNEPCNHIYPVAMSRLPKKNNANVKNTNVNDRILMVCNAPEICELGRGFICDNYTNRQMRFIDNLNNSNRHKLVIRTRSGKEVSDLENRCKKKYPYVKFESYLDCSIEDSILNSIVVVCDYFGSSHVEALVLGKPFLMFDGIENVCPNPSLKDVIDMMDENGIYKRDGEDVAKMINEHDDLNAWLKSEKIKKIYDVYKKDMIGLDKDPVKCWYEELIS